MFAPMWHRTFLYQVWQKDKVLFTLFTSFILGQFFFSYKGVENTPFFHYGMYSAPHQSQESYIVYRIGIDKVPVLSGNFLDAQREIVYNTLAAYDGLKQQDFKDSLERVIIKRFGNGNMSNGLRTALLNNAQMDTPYQKWLFSYIADMRMIETPKFGVVKERVVYQPDGTLISENMNVLIWPNNE